MSSPTETARHGFPWSREEERFVYDAFCKGASAIEIASALRRRVGGIQARLKRLGLLDEAGLRVKPRPAFTPYTDRLAGDDRRFDGFKIEAPPDPCARRAMQPVWPIEGFPSCELLSLRAQATLRMAGFATVQEVIDCDAWRLLRIPNCGRKTLREIKAAAEEDARKAAAAASGSGALEAPHGKAAPPEAAEARLPPLTQEEFERGAARMIEGMAARFAELLDTLAQGDRDDRIFAARFAIDQGAVRTLADLGDEHNISRERIRQIEVKGVRQWTMKLFPRAEQRKIHAFVSRAPLLTEPEREEAIARRLVQMRMSSQVKGLLLSIFIKFASERRRSHLRSLQRAKQIVKTLQQAERGDPLEPRRGERRADHSAGFDDPAPGRGEKTGRVPARDGGDAFSVE